MSAPVVAVLALQGDVDAHGAALARRGVAWRAARTPDEILSADALVLPGGESTAMWKLMSGTGLEEAIRAFAASGRPVLGTCAGAILLADAVTNPPRPGLGLLPATIERNAYGRQLDSAVVPLRDVHPRLAFGGPLEAVFIRAPKFTRLGDGVEVLARRDGDPVLVRKENVMAATFHPELTDDPRVHDLFLAGRSAPATGASGRRIA